VEIAALQKRSADQQANADRLQNRLSAQEAQVAELLQLNNDIRSQGTARDEELARMRKSLSWRVTRPLRWIRRSQIAGRELVSGKWVRFRVKAILIYHRMSLQHPKLAWILRRTLRPFFRVMNRLLVTGPIVTPERDANILLAPMLYQQYERGAGFTPLVSVIVPNYNHAPYLELRLNSIFSQTYQNIEVIMLDDASTDGSDAILGKFYRRYPDKSRLILNESNSGGVFHQWEKGLQLAQGEIIWIAESDDWCSENFLETLVQFFENEAVQLAHCRTVFTDDSGREEIWSINEYLHDLDKERWNHTIVETGHKIVPEAFALKNIIPNVSSAIFRNPRHLEILKDPEWKQMQTCGDWLLYLHLIRGGMLAYSPAARSYYRLHGDNTSVKSYAEDRFYIEHEIVARAARQYFRVDDDIFLRQKRNLAAHWRENRASYTDEAFDACYSVARITESRLPPAPNLLMASYAFTVGGGETFPIQLANVMKAAGYNVTYLDCAREPRNQGIRKNLRPDIPIVSDFSQLERIVTDFGNDIIHSHHAWVDSTILDVLPESTPCKTVVTLHGMYETINDYDLRSILPRLVKRSARLIYVAEKNLTALRDHKLIDKASLVRIDNALSPDAFDEVDRASLGIPQEAFVLSLVSRALADKGWEEAIASVSRAREMSGRDIHLLLVGDGPEYERLLLEELPEFIHLEGFKRNVRGYFAVADAGYLPSRFKGESFPLVIIECLQSGRPFVSSNLGEVAYMLDGPEGMAGILVDLDGDCLDIEQLAREISRLATDAELYQKLLSRVPAAARKFDPAVLTEKYDAVYRGVMAGRGA
jgi:glycosyltransferase involved in cell wall biosynthesis